VPAEINEAEALKAAMAVALALDLRWGRVEFDVVDRRVRSLEFRRRVDERDARRAPDERLSGGPPPGETLAK
jgi:hypothetical protein